MALQPEGEQITLLQNIQLEVIEVGHGIGLRPETDSTCRERLIAKIKDRLLIVKHLDLTATIDHVQRVPLIQMDRLVEVL